MHWLEDNTLQSENYSNKTYNIAPKTKVQQNVKQWSEKAW